LGRSLIDLLGTIHALETCGGRMLSKEDITHYQKIVVVLSETIRLMKEIDQVVDAHGGWPDAFLRASESNAEMLASAEIPI
jgi:hypothetical protein